MAKRPTGPQPPSSDPLKTHGPAPVKSEQSAIEEAPIGWDQPAPDSPLSEPDARVQSSSGTSHPVISRGPDAAYHAQPYSLAHSTSGTPLIGPAISGASAMSQSANTQVGGVFHAVNNASSMQFALTSLRSNNASVSQQAATAPAQPHINDLTTELPNTQQPGQSVSTTSGESLPQGSAAQRPPQTALTQSVTTGTPHPLTSTGPAVDSTTQPPTQSPTTIPGSGQTTDENSTPPTPDGHTPVGTIPPIASTPQEPNQTPDGGSRLPSTGGQASTGLTPLGAIATTSPITPSSSQLAIAGVDSGSTTEDYTTSATGQLVLSGSQETPQWHVDTPRGQYGQLQIDASGQWAYQLDNRNPAVQALAAGERVSDTFLVTANSHGKSSQATVTLDINGNNDGPTLLPGAQVHALLDMTSATEASGSVKATDIDHQAQLNWAGIDQQGQFGHFHYDQLAGQWHYQIDPSLPAAQALPSGASASETFTLSVTDEHGSSTQQHVIVTVVGTNDAPVMAAVPAQHLLEGSQLVLGQLAAQDPDGTDGLIFSSSFPVPGFRLSPDGSYRFDPSHSAYTPMAEGSVQQIDIPVKVTDPSGGSDTQTITLILTGTNQAPVLSTIAPLAVNEGDPTVHGQLQAVDSDTGDTISFSTAQTLPGFTINPNGSFSFNPSDNHYNSLSAGQSQTYTIPISATDAHGASHSQDLVITLTGTNDIPVINAITPAVATEGGGVITGKILSSDPDLPDSATFSSGLRVPGFHLTPDGHYSFNPSDSAYAGLNAGQQQQLSIPITVTDDHGASASQNLVITLTGQNGSALITGVHSGEVIEDHLVKGNTQLLASGQLTIGDPDTAEDHFISQTGLQGLHGSFDIAADGLWHYSANNSAPAIQQLGAGAQLIDTFTVHSADGTPAQISVIITGSNDAPTVAAAITDQSAAQGSGFLFAIPDGAFTDIDTGDSLTLSTSTLPSWLSFDASSGTFTGTPSNADVGTTALTVTATDSHGAKVSSTFNLVVNNTNDAPTLNPIARVTVSEDGQQVHGQLTATDPDTGDTLTFSIAAPVAGLSINTDGSWHFDPSDGAYQSLAAGQPQTLSIPVTVTDTLGATATQTLVIQLTGTNDGPVLSAVPTASMTEDGTVITGTMLGTDIDSGDSLVYSIAAPVAGFTINTDGSWRFDPSDGAYQSLAAGQPQTLSIPVTGTDTTGATASQTLVIQLIGTDDRPVLSATPAANATEDGAVVTGTMLSTDVDTGDSLVYHIAAPVAGLTMNTDGSWRFDPSDTAYQHLGAGQPQTLTIPVTVTDSAGASAAQNLVIHLTGTNDTPVITSAAADAQGSSTEDVTSLARGQLSATDLDTGDTLSWHVVSSSVSATTPGVGLFGRFAIDTHSGQWAYRLDQSRHTQHLPDGQQEHETFTVRATDGHGGTVDQTVTVTITGSNDAPTVSQVISTQSANEDTAFQFAVPTGTFADIDTGDTLTLSTGTLPSWLSFDASSGTFTGTPSNADVGTIALTVTATDSHGAKVSSTFDLVVNNTNDAPTLNPIARVIVSEDGQQVHGQLTATDPDTGDSLTFNIATAVDGLTFNSDGSWSFDPSHNQYQSLPDGQNQTLTIPVTVTDSAGATDNRSLVIQLTGTNDAPAVSHVVTSQAASEDTAFHFALPTGTFADIDTGDTLTLSTGTLPSWLSFDASSGTFTGTPSNADVGTTALTVTATDSHGAKVSTTFDLTVSNTNDAPTLNPVSTQTTTEGGLWLSGQITATDPDTGDTLSYATHATVDGFSLHSDGSWSFNPTDRAYNHLPAGRVETLTIPLTVTDATGATDTGSLTIQITGSNDAPYLVGRNTYVRNEDDGVISHQMLVADFDSGEGAAGTHLSTTATVPGFTLGADTFTFNPSDPAYQHLAAGEPLDIVIPITVTDASGANSTISDAITIHLTGTNDAPVVSHVVTSQAASEDTAFHFALPAGTFTDVDTGDILTLSTGTLPSWLSFDASSGTFTGTPSNADVGTTALTVTATDSHGAKVSSTFNLVVSNANDAPTLNPIARVTVSEDGQQVHGQLTATDPDTGDTLTFGIAAPVAGLTMNTDGSWRFDPSDTAYQHLGAGQPQTLTIPVTVTDSAGASAAQNLVIHLTGTNDTPVITSAAADAQGSSTEDVTSLARGQLSATDLDTGDTLTWQVVSSSVSAANPSVGHFGYFAINGNSGEWAYRLDQGHRTQHLLDGQQEHETFTVRATDGHGGSVDQTVTVTITGSNDAPTVSQVISTQSANEDTAFQFAVPTGTFADIDTGDTLTLSTGTLPSWLSFDASSGTFTGTPSNADVGTTALTVTATDSHGAKVSTTFDLTVSNTNDAPTLNPVSTQTTTEGGLWLSGQITATDPDTGDTLSYATHATVDGFSLHSDGSWSFNPTDRAYNHLPAGRVETLTIPLTVTDATGATDTGSLTIQITGSNDAPYLVGRNTYVRNEDDGVISHQMLVADFDSGEGAAGTHLSTTATVPGFTLGADTFTFNPSDPAYQHLAAGEPLDIVIPITVTDASGANSTISDAITIHLTGTNDAPVVSHVVTSQAASEDTAFHFSLPAGTFTDVDTGDTLTLSTGTLPNWLSFDASTGVFSGTPDGADIGTTQISVTATDPQGQSIDTVFSLTVQSGTQPPTLTPIQTANQGTSGVAPDVNPAPPVASGHADSGPLTGDARPPESELLTLADHDNSALQPYLDLVANHDVGTTSSVDVSTEVADYLDIVNVSAENLTAPPIDSLLQSLEPAGALTFGTTDDNNAADIYDLGDDAISIDPPDILPGQDEPPLHG